MTGANPASLWYSACAAHTTEDSDLVAARDFMLQSSARSVRPKTYTAIPATRSICQADELDPLQVRLYTGCRRRGSAQPRLAAEVAQASTLPMPTWFRPCCGISSRTFPLHLAHRPRSASTGNDEFLLIARRGVLCRILRCHDLSCCARRAFLPAWSLGYQGGERRIARQLCAWSSV